MSEHNIRPATPQDMPRVWELINELAEFERLTHAVVGTEHKLVNDLNKHFLCDVYEFEGEIVAYTLYFHTYSTFRTQAGVWMEDLYVTPKMRGKGVGKQLLEHVIRTARSKGFGRVEWSVLDWNTNAIAFYEKLGATLLPDWRVCRVSLDD